jgi:hypothetical protein
MEEPAVEKLIGEQLPKIQLAQNQWRNQTEVVFQSIIGRQAEKRLQDKYSDVGDQEKLDRRGNAAGAERETSSLILHYDLV